MESLLVKPLPTKPPLANAPPCAASQLVVASVDPLQITQDVGFSVALRNTGRTACLLRGRPHVVASKPGKPTVTARPEGMAPDSEIANTDPGKLVSVWIDIPVICAADPGGGNQGLPGYNHLLISFPGGGSKLIAVRSVTMACGMGVTPFFTGKPPPVYPPDPLVHLVSRLRLPAAVKPGTILRYQVELFNPGSRAVPLSPCPGYIEHSYIPTKLEYELNCRSVHAIPAHGEVTYDMEMAIPDSASAGSAEVFWGLLVCCMPQARGVVHVR